MRKQYGQGGFSVVEILVALVVVSMLAGVIINIVINGQSLNSKTNLRAEAGSLAFKKIQDYINLSYDNIPIGDDVSAYEVEDFSTEAEALKLNNAEAKVYIEPASVLPTGGGTSTTNFTQTIVADSAFVSGSEIQIAGNGVDDATGDYWREWRISDDNFSNYTYNRYDPGADNLPTPSIDLETAQTLGTIRVTWWSCSYGANDFRIEGKNSNPNSNSGWSTVIDGLDDGGFPCAGNKSQDIDVSSNTTPYRYWRLYIVDATHSTWNVISELEAFSAGVPGDIVEQSGVDGSLDFSSSDLDMTQHSSNGQQSVGLIFDDIDTTQGASITDAYIEFTADESDSGGVTLLVTGVDRDNAVSWNGNYGVDNAVDNDGSDGSVGTTATTSWVPPAWTAGDKGTNTRVDVTAIVQEIVDRPGWAVDNDMAFAVQYVSGSDRRVAERSPEPELVINWSETVNNPTPGGYVDNDNDGDVDNPTLLRATAVVEYDAFGQRHRVEYATFIRKFGVSD